MKRALTVFCICFMLTSVSTGQNNVFSPGPAMSSNRMNQFSFNLPDGSVALIGGHGTGFASLGTAEIFTAAQSEFTQYNMQYIHDMAAVSQLSDGTWLIAGGSHDLGVAPGIAGAEIYNPANGTFTAIASMNYPRCICTAVTLANNNVLVVGGWYDATSATYAEVYDNSAKTFSATQAMVTPRSNAVALATSDSGAVVFGGYYYYGGTAYESVEYYNHTTSAFTQLQDHLFPDDSAWFTQSDIYMRPMTGQRMKNGEYLMGAWKAFGDTSKYTLATFNPDTKTFAKFELAKPLPNSADSVQFFRGPLLDTAKNVAYWLAIKSGSDPWKMQLYTIDLTNKTWQASGFYNTNYYWTSCSMNLLPNGDLLVCGGTTSSDYYTNFNPVDSTIIITGSVTAVNDKPNALPAKFSLGQNYPNPFNPSTVIEYSVPKAGLVTITVYDALGREVSALVREVKAAGSYTVQLNAANMPSGIYFYRMNSGSFSQTKKLVVLK